MYYLAYGSNLHPARLQRRCPSAVSLGSVRIDGYQLRFHKLGQDGSGKCNLLASNKHHAYGALYRLAGRDLPELDRVEGHGRGYGKVCHRLPLTDGPCEAWSYIASPGYIDDRLQPWHWYKELVLCGARFHGMSADYVESIQAVGAIDDTDQKRRAEHEQLLAAMLAHDTMHSASG